MIKLACNYYPEVVELIRDGLINVDIIKFPALGYQMSVFDDINDFSVLANEINTLRPLMLHGIGPDFLNIGSSGFIADIDDRKEKTKRIIDLTGINGISNHLTVEDKTRSREENKSIIKRNIGHLKEVFPNKEFYSFENVDSIKQFGICVEPEFITEIIKETDSDFLLDISHAYCVSKELGVNFYEYLKRLPLDKIYEVHLNGWIENGAEIMCHTKINESGYEALEWVLARCDAKIVTLEYGRHNDRLNAGIPIMSPSEINKKAKEEIACQIDSLDKILGRNT